MIVVPWGALLEDLEQRSVKTMREVCLRVRFYPLIEHMDDMDARVAAAVSTADGSGEEIK